MTANMKSLRSLVLLLAVGAFPAFLSSQANPNSLNVGVAQVNGELHLVAGDPAASLADFALASADGGARPEYALGCGRDFHAPKKLSFNHVGNRTGGATLKIAHST